MNKKTSISFLIVAITILFIGSTITKNYKKDEIISKDPYLSLSKFEVLAPVDRQNRIDHVMLTNGREYKKYSLTKDGPQNLIITYFQINLNTIKSTNLELRRHQQGILVFREDKNGEIKLIFESKNNYSSPRIKIGIYDLTGDGVNEILALLDNDQGGAMLIYKWNGSDFDMITPYVKYTRFDGKQTDELAFGADSGMTKIFDIDKDGIPEISFPVNIFLGLDENSDAKNEIKFQAYKWNGTEYFLWKEQKEPFMGRDGRDEYSAIDIIDL